MSGKKEKSGMFDSQAHRIYDARVLALTASKGASSLVRCGGGASNLAHSVRRFVFGLLDAVARLSAFIRKQSGSNNHNHNSIGFSKTAALALGRLSVFALIRRLDGYGRFFVSEFAGGTRAAQPVGSLR